MLSRSLLALTLIALAVPAWADNFAYRDASGRNIVFPCTDGGGVCTPTVAGSPTTDQEVDLVEVGGVPIALGQATMAASIPVAIASNQSEVPVGGSGTAGTADASVVTVQGIASMTPVQVSQATASNLNATVVGTGTFTTQSAQSGTWTVQPGNTANTTPWLVGGNVAGAAADSGNPNKIGGVYNSTPPTYTTGQRTDAQSDTRGNLKTTIIDGGGTTSLWVGTPADDTTNAMNAAYVQSFPSFYDGTTWDRAKQAANATDSTGVGIAATAILGQLDNTSPTAITENQFGNLRMDPARNLGVAPSPYPVNAIASTATSGTVSNAAAVATLTGVASRTMYITGYDCHAGAATAAGRLSIVVSGTISGSMTNSAFVTNGTTFVPAPFPTIVSYNPPIPASAPNTSIVVTMQASGAGGASASCNAYGFTLP